MANANVFAAPDSSPESSHSSDSPANAAKVRRNKLGVVSPAIFFGAPAPSPESPFPSDSHVAPRTFRSVAKAQRNRFGAWLNQLGLDHKDFSVLSNDCWSTSLYEEWNLPLRSPFRGLGMQADSYLRFLGDLNRYLQEPLQFVRDSKVEKINQLRLLHPRWPIALLGGDVEIHFLHFRSEEEGRRTWEQGCRAINRDRLAVVFTVDKDGALPEHIAAFSRLPFERKLLISKRRHADVRCAVRVRRYVNNGGMMFRRSLCYFDCAHWLNTGEVRLVTPRTLLNKLLYLRGA